MGHGFEITNVRAWESRPDTNFGPTAWHADGFSSYVRKILLYLQPMNLRNGTLELYDRSGNKILLNTTEASCILFDNSALLHRGRASTSNVLRKVIEVAIIPAPKTKVKYVYAGQNARIPKAFAQEIVVALETRRFRKVASEEVNNVKIESSNNNSFLARLTSLFNARTDKIFSLSSKYAGSRFVSNETTEAPELTNYKEFLNIGGGPSFDYPGWINLEGVTSSTNPFPFDLTSNCRFPVPSGTVRVVYSSHCLEHLDDDTVLRIIREARRVLGKSGRLVIKIPNYEDVIEAWQSSNNLYFSEQWGLEDVVDTWRNKDIADTIDYRASMVFCGFWNSNWGQHFDLNRPKNGNLSYHGPAPMGIEKLRELLKTSNPRKIVQSLVSNVRETQKDYSFNHQNAWSRNEFCELLVNNGFDVVSTNSRYICDNYSRIPGITDMYSISSYYEAVISNPS